LSICRGLRRRYSGFERRQRYLGCGKDDQYASQRLIRAGIQNNALDPGRGLGRKSVVHCNHQDDRKYD
jgi:hypothetical protein